MNRLSLKIGMDFFEIEKRENVVWVWLNNPKRYNMMNINFWEQLPQILQDLNKDTSVKTIVLAGRGKSFSAGLDIDNFIEQFPWMQEAQSAEQNDRLLTLIEQMQAAVNTVAALDVPVLAAVHGHCIGGGLDLISACDIRLASENASFSLREAKVHIVADMGSLQRLPYIIGEGHTRELALSGKDIDAQTALSMGLVTHVYLNREELFAAAQTLAEELAKNSRLVMKGVKHVMNYGQNHSLQSSLDYVKTYNGGFLRSQEFLDMLKFLREKREKRKKVASL